MDVFDVFATVGSLLFMAALLPQGWRTMRLGRADDISVAFLLTVLMASASMLVWSLHIRAGIVAASFVANLLVWGYVLYVRLHPRAAPS